MIRYGDFGSRAGHSMQVDIIDSYDVLLGLKGDWEAVYQADPEANFFLSWTWMTRWLEDDRSAWFILAARKNNGASDHGAFFPLRVRAKATADGRFVNEIAMAGRNFSDYAGLICDPLFEADVIAAFAKCIKKTNWAGIRFDCLRISERRFRLLMAHFPADAFPQSPIAMVNKHDNVDNSICPYVRLPQSWDNYLDTLSSSTRQKLKRLLRRVEGDDEFRISHSTAVTISRDLDILLHFWEIKWRERKSQYIASLLETNCRMLKRSFDAGDLFVPVLWHGDRPLGALACFVDRQKRTLLFFITGRDESFNNPSPGLVLHAHTVRFAIDCGFEMYDFLRGNEPYKYSFRPDEFRLKCVVVGTKDGRNLGNRLHPRTVPEVRQRTLEMHKRGRLEAAEQAYRQILEVEPNDLDALNGLVKLTMSRRRFREAARLVRRIIAIKPNAAAAWLMLGQLHEAEGRVDAAAGAYQQLRSRRPEDPSAQNRAGHALMKLGHVDAGLAAFAAACRLSPDDAEAELSLGNALHSVGRLPPGDRPHYAALNISFGDKAAAEDKTDRAIACYRQAIAIAPKLARAHFALARSLGAVGRAHEARQSLQQALDCEAEIQNGTRMNRLSALQRSGSARPPRRAKPRQHQLSK